MHKSHLNPPAPPHVAVLLFPETQLLDTSPIDLFGMQHPSYLTTCDLPAPLCAQGTPWRISFASAKPAGTPATLTAQARLVTSHALADAPVAPGNVDVLLVPGPEPAYVASADEKAFITAHEAAGAHVLTVCTGAIPAAQAGLLDGRRATAPRALLAGLRKRFPKVKWEEKRWVRDGRVWNSGGITNGLDLTAAFLREVYPGPATEMVLTMADVDDRGQEYSTSAPAETAFVLWQIVRSVFRGVFGLGKNTGETMKQS